MDLAKAKTIRNSDQSRFELALAGELAFIDYKLGKSGNVYLIHTEVPKTLTGKGAGHKLVRESFHIIEEGGGKIIPLCPFIRSFLNKHMEDYRELLAEGVKL